MATTSLKLPQDIKTQAVSAAKSMGISTHAFMVDAISQAATAAKQRAQFVAEAKTARKAMISSGTGLDAEEVHAYLRKRVAGKSASVPKARSWQS
jgi:predicted transcriptional regulator